MPEIKQPKAVTMLEYQGKPFNIKSKVFQTQQDVNGAFFKPEDVKKLEKSGHLKATAAYKSALEKAEAEQEAHNKALNKK